MEKSKGKNKKSKIKIITNGAQKTKRFAKKFARKLNGNELIFLIGNLGSGKTTFVQGLAKGLAIKESVRSPSFVLIKEYTFSENKKLIHLDLYRLNKQAEIKNLGLEEYTKSKNIIVVEWPEKLKKWPRKPDYLVNFSHRGENERQIEICK